MTIRLRGHHLLCLLGYRGMGYSADFCVNMTGIYETLRTKPDTRIEIVKGVDDICRAYPPDKENHCDGTVHELDQAVLAKLGLVPGFRGEWQEVCGYVARQVEPSDIENLCVTCPWKSYGVCQEGVQLVREGRQLPEVKPQT
ncbi:DUF1284 domain-containing protein [Paenibacillus sp. 7124]|uniref:DUF1284 domain-containing protein n=1 Tax=Paenibacillus apii TaxID=1850370 RepID=A0A6M1PKV3_9BACL|nr:DUF1284 domain-containing protein [Paenibacillus apii]NGM83890.1 DUF1284 domain-containing protein [Paenibacillus apii]NJJ40592.1 DUF1284 domain-containing protein [Paenibacillus apii]